MWYVLDSTSSIHDPYPVNKRKYAEMIVNVKWKRESALKVILNVNMVINVNANAMVTLGFRTFDCVMMKSNYEWHFHAVVRVRISQVSEGLGR